MKVQANDVRLASTNVGQHLDVTIVCRPEVHFLF